VLAEFERLSERGGVLGAMETGYQRGRIQDDSMLYEEKKHDGTLPIVGVNTFVNPHPRAPPAHGAGPCHRGGEGGPAPPTRRLPRPPRRRVPGALDELRRVCLEGGNVFEALMSTVRHASLGQITQTLFEVGGSYRRNV